MGREHDVRLVLAGEPGEELRRGGGFPKEFVHAPRAAVAHEHARAVRLEADLAGEAAHPAAPPLVRVPEGVAVREPREVVVARIGVAALAVVESARDRIVVVPPHHADVMVDEEREDPVRVGAERPEVAEAVERVRPPGGGVLDRGRQRQVVAVDAPEDGDPARFGFRRHPARCPRSWNRSRRAASTCSRRIRRAAPGRTPPPASNPCAPPASR